MTIKAIIWDVGGVLMRTEDHTPRDQLAADLGVPRDHVEMTVFAGEIGGRAQRGEIGVAELWEFVRQAYDLTHGELIRFEERFWGGDVLDANLIDTIRTLKANYHIGLLSNAWLDLRAVITGRWKIVDAFDSLTISAEEGVVKPDAQIYQIALARAGVLPPESVFIDDFPHNIAGAQKAGMHGILFKNPQQTLKELDILLE